MTLSDEAFRRLSYHETLGPSQQALYEENRARYIELFSYIENLGGRGSRELSLAMTALQESLFWVNAHIACNGIENYSGPEVP